MPPFGPVSRRTLLIGGVAVAAGVTGCAGPIPESLDDGPWGWTRQAGPLELGVTHTEHSLAPADPGPRDRSGPGRRYAGARSHFGEGGPGTAAVIDAVRSAV